MSALWLHVRIASIAVAAAGVLFVVFACGGAPAPVNNAPAPSAPSSAQCGKDSDCKGDRVCDHGQCVSPR